MKNNERLIYTNANGASVEFSWFSNYTPLAFLDELENEITSNKNNQQDGEIYISDSLSSREITINGFFKLATDDLLERNLKRTLNPKLSGILTFDNGDTVKTIKVKLTNMVEIQRKSRMAMFNVEFLAHDPFWRTEERTEYIALLQKKLVFPVRLPNIFGFKRSALETTIENMGDVASGFRVIFKAKGSVVNPEIVNRYTGEKIKLYYTMDKGDTVEVINETTKKMVYINGVKDFSKLDRLHSQFFQLEIGKNLIGYGADENVVNLDVIVYYSPLFL